RRIAALSISMNLLKLHRQSVSFVIDEPQARAAFEALAAEGFRCQVTPSVSMLSVYAAEMRYLSGVMGRIAATMARERIPIVQTGDGPDTVFCLVERAHAPAASAALRAEFGVEATRRRLVVQKFGGKSVGT